MTCTLVLAVIIAVLCLAIAFARQQQVIQVVPDMPGDHYQGNCTVDECYTITELIRNSSYRIRGSNLKITFLPGTCTHC